MALNSKVINLKVINDADTTGITQALITTVSSGITIVKALTKTITSTLVNSLVTLLKFVPKTLTTTLEISIIVFTHLINYLILFVISATSTLSIIKAIAKQIIVTTSSVINGSGINFGAINQAATNTVIGVISTASIIINLAYNKTLIVASTSITTVSTLISKSLFNVTTILTVLRTTLSKILSTNVITFITSGINFVAGAGASFTYTIYVPLKRRLLNLLRIREVSYNHNDNVNREDSNG